MDQTIEARILRFERSHSVPRSCDQWQLKTRLPGLDMDVRSLLSTPSLLSDTNRGLAINRCCDEVIDRLSDIMTEYSDSFKAMRDWTAWRLYSVEGLSIDRSAQVDTAKVIITRRRIIQVENMERNHPK